MESARSTISTDPLPYFVGVIAARSVLILNSPLHFMYTKINKFLNKSPEWNISKLPSYWIGKIILTPPTEDDAHHREVAWLLDALIDGLRTASVTAPSQYHSLRDADDEYRIWKYIAEAVFLKGYCHCQHLLQHPKFGLRRSSNYSTAARW